MEIGKKNIEIISKNDKMMPKSENLEYLDSKTWSWIETLANEPESREKSAENEDNRQKICL